MDRCIPEREGLPRLPREAYAPGAAKSGLLIGKQRKAVYSGVPKFFEVFAAEKIVEVCSWSVQKQARQGLMRCGHICCSRGKQQHCRDRSAAAAAPSEHMFCSGGGRGKKKNGCFCRSAV